MPIDFPPYVFLDREKQPNGMLVDYWKLLANKSGIAIELVPMIPKAILADLVNNNVFVSITFFDFYNQNYALNIFIKSQQTLVVFTVKQH